MWCGLLAAAVRPRLLQRLQGKEMRKVGNQVAVHALRHASRCKPSRWRLSNTPVTATILCGMDQRSMQAIIGVHQLKTLH